MAKIKQLLTLLGSFTIIGAAATTISCGVSLTTLENRIIDNSTFKTIFNSSIQNWNMPASMQSTDLKVLANTQDTLMTYVKNEKNEYDLKPLLADVKGDGNTATVTLRDNAKWFNSTTGEFIRQMNAGDLVRTGLYILNPNNVAETTKDWIQFISGAKEYWDSNHDEEAQKAFIKAAFSLDEMPKDDAKEVTYNLLTKSDLFETALVSPSFSPMPQEAIKGGYSYGRPKYENVLFSGPYYISSNDATGMTFNINPNYKNANGTIKTIEWVKTSNKDWGSVRTLFETGDVSEAQLSPSDKYGWDKFIGDDKNNPKFDKVQIQPNNQIGLKNLLFNYANTDKENGYRSNVALSSDIVRSWIAYAMDRSTFVKYFSGPRDLKNKNSYLVNTLNPSGYLKDKSSGKDYTDLVAEKAGTTVDKIKMGEDFYLHNEKLLPDSSTKDTIKNDVRKYLDSQGIKGKVELTMLISGDNETTFNPYIRQMLNEFNSIEDNPIVITPLEKHDDSGYQMAQQVGDFSMFITGWGPNYLDPMAFLQSQELNGGMSSYMGYDRLTKSNDPYYKDLKEDLTEYTDSINKASETDDYDAFAQAEANLLYKYKVSIPLYKPNGPSLYYLSYADLNTKANKGFGNGDFRLENVKMLKSLKELDSKNKNEKQEPIIKEN